jgi:hypothetical protein
MATRLLLLLQLLLFSCASRLLLTLGLGSLAPDARSADPGSACPRQAPRLASALRLRSLTSRRCGYRGGRLGIAVAGLCGRRCLRGSIRGRTSSDQKGDSDEWHRPRRCDYEAAWSLPEVTHLRDAMAKN